MRRLTSRIGTLAATALLTLAGTSAAQAANGHTQTPHASAEAAYFNLHDSSGSDFVIELTDPNKISEARDIVSTGGDQLVIGTIEKQPASYNPPWSFHLQPDTIHFADMAIEVCDANIPYVEEHLDEVGGALLPGQVWCPWSGRLTHEVTP
ncbi:calmodulin-binding protein [Streptomyces sp. NPDC052051]|uniref:BP74-related protein n=1 Tax=Streptomyces sp. NPDC052051 TaxID=3154649 RepID=UPI00342394C6